MNIDEIYNECVSYIYNNREEDEEIIKEIEGTTIGISNYPNKFGWGTTPFNTFKLLINEVNRPKRFIIWGSSVGYMCFFWNNLYPDIETIGIDIHSGRVNFAKKIQNKYNLNNNIKFVVEDISKFDIQDGDLIWQNNLLFDDVEELNSHIFYNYDVQIISYRKLFNNYKISNNTLVYNQEVIKFMEYEIKAETSWTNNQNFFVYKKYTNEYTQIIEVKNLDIKLDESCLDNYDNMNNFKFNIVSDRLRYLYNKNNIKKEFIKIGFNVPKTLFYSNSPCQTINITNTKDQIVCKAAHLSEGDFVFIKNNNTDLIKLQNNLNSSLKVCARDNEPLMLKECERGILIEEYINVVYELKVFVVFGYPLVADLRTGSTEVDRINFINLNNDFLDWSMEFELIKKFSKEINLDFYRIDFLFDGHKLYASECAFMPSTIIPDYIKDMILEKWRTPYFNYYYPSMSI
jgi:hypothetical protein